MSQIFIIIVILIQIYLVESQKLYKLDIKNENLDDNPIILVPGKFTKIFLLLTNLKGNEYIYNDESSYTLTLEDDKIISLKKELILTPQENLIYINYIGLSCSNIIKDEKYTFSLKAKGRNHTDSQSIEIKNITVLIEKKNKTKINLEVLFKSMDINNKIFLN